MSDAPSYAELQTWAMNAFAGSQIAVSPREVQLLLMGAAELDRAGLIGRERDVCPLATRQRFSEFVARRLRHEPVYRILGRREFHGLDLQLNEATLEPRDDSECLLDAVFETISDNRAALRFLDLGTGTGALALALLVELPNASCIAVDVEPRALQAATLNAEAHGLRNRFEPLQSSWFENITGRFDFIISNPPYIASSVMRELEPEVRLYDPPAALDGGVDGLDAYRIILEQGRDHLLPDGFLGLEIGHDQKRSVSQLARQSQWQVVQSYRDLAENDRVLIIR
ncbi:MAG: peptide chain release factor N(5)-glutamine methyltransferase [Rhizobiaceae bacterium]